VCGFLTMDPLQQTSMLQKMEDSKTSWVSWVIEYSLLQFQAALPWEFQ